jgi:hypothetical protein
MISLHIITLAHVLRSLGREDGRNVEVVVVRVVGFCILILMVHIIMTWRWRKEVDGQGGGAVRK